MTAIARLLDEFSRRRRPLRSLGASGQLGYGIPTPALEAGLPAVTLEMVTPEPLP